MAAGDAQPRPDRGRARELTPRAKHPCSCPSTRARPAGPIVPGAEAEWGRRRRRAGRPRENDGPVEARSDASQTTPVPDGPGSLNNGKRGAVRLCDSLRSYRTSTSTPGRRVLNSIPGSRRSRRSSIITSRSRRLRPIVTSRSLLSTQRSRHTGPTQSWRHTRSALAGCESNVVPTMVAAAATA